VAVAGPLAFKSILDNIDDYLDYLVSKHYKPQPMLFDFVSFGALRLSDEVVDILIAKCNCKTS